MIPEEFLQNALSEDVGDGDHTSIACIPPGATGTAKLMIKEDCIIAGISVAKTIYRILSPGIVFRDCVEDGNNAKKGTIAFYVDGPARQILIGERLVLNFMQRMSGIATLTRQMVQAVKGTGTKILDTRKTTPNFRYFEKWAVKIGGGENHRFGLYDMILVKDNHVDYSGGITNAIRLVKNYLQSEKKDLLIEVEARNINEVKEILSAGGVYRILLDNFTVEQTREAVNLINRQCKTESSGNISINNIREYALSGVDFISLGALTHSYKSIDLSLKALNFQGNFLNPEP